MLVRQRHLRPRCGLSHMQPSSCLLIWPTTPLSCSEEWQANVVALLAMPFGIGADKNIKYNTLVLSLGR